MGVGKGLAFNALDTRQSCRRVYTDIILRTTGKDEHIFCDFWLEKVFVVVVWDV